MHTVLTSNKWVCNSKINNITQLYRFSLEVKSMKLLTPVTCAEVWPRAAAVLHDYLKCSFKLVVDLV